MENDQELKAIKEIITALEGLEDDARLRTVNYVFDRLGLNKNVAPANKSNGDGTSTIQVPTPTVASENISPINIRTLKEQRNPDSAIHMAVLVAYYLQELASELERKDTIGVEDLKKYFKQAAFPLPKLPISALKNAKAAGYLESAERGQYKLNPVGYNLAAYSLPGRGANNGTKKRAKKTKSKKGS